MVMKKSAAVSFGCVLFLLGARALQAQTGCTDSPENLTVVLALVGGAGALFSAVRARVRSNSCQR